METPKASNRLEQNTDPFQNVDNQNLNSMQIIGVISSDDYAFVDATFDDSIESSLETTINTKNKTFLSNSWATLEDEDISNDNSEEEDINEAKMN